MLLLSFWCFNLNLSEFLCSVSCFFLQILNLLCVSLFDTCGWCDGFLVFPQEML